MWEKKVRIYIIPRVPNNNPNFTYPTPKITHINQAKNV